MKYIVKYIERLRNRAKFAKEEAKYQPAAIAARILAYAEIYNEVASELSALKEKDGDVLLGDRVYPNRTYPIDKIRKWKVIKLDNKV